MAEQPTTLQIAEAMLGQLRACPAGHAHELATAMLASASVYLVEAFGREHALKVARDILPTVLGAGAVPEMLAGEAAEAAPAVVLH